ncbi:MAG TPA: CCA tRNA nucleotidyltransferase [Kiritimatiellia bacterium]|nr:CCA tRNA nucleotidyltransferase [Kiritimatiellia bacterium]HMP34682.1 CCA tRNA nucleotidyltransferase [Kiritimatiellia bacterium]
MSGSPTRKPVTLDASLVPPTIRDAASQVVTSLRSAGHQAYFAGGFARDLLIGRPVHDIDIATDAPPNRVESLFPDSRSFGKSFGVVQVIIDDCPFEVATFRTEGPYRDGRRPESVRFTTPDEDARRRDFTINGMFYDPASGEVIDYVGGLADLERRLIRAIGIPAERFAEDHLRILRAIRFASVLEFDIDPATLQAMRDHADDLRAISPERIRDELIRTLMEAPHPGTALKRLSATGILAVILPEVEAMHGVEQPPDYHPEGDVFEHVCLMLETMKERTPALVWSILMHDVAKPATFSIQPDRQGNPRIRFFGHDEQGAIMAADILRRFRCPNQLIDDVVIAVRNHMRFAAVPEMRAATLRKWVGAPTFPLELELHRIDCLSSHGSLDHYDQIRTFRDTLTTEPALPRPLITGKDLMQRGLTPGPHLGRVLKSIYEQQLEGSFSDRITAEAWLDQHLDTLRASPDIQP